MRVKAMEVEFPNFLDAGDRVRQLALVLPLKYHWFSSFY